MAQETRLDVFDVERLAQQGIRIEIDLTDREVVCRAPVRMHFAQFLGRQWISGLVWIRESCRRCGAHSLVLPLFGLSGSLLE